MTSSLHDCLSNSSSLHTILQKVALHKRLTQQLHQFLPDVKLHHQVCVANFRDNQLILQATNSAVATQLRYLTSDLVQQFRTKGQLAQLITIKIIVETASELKI